MKYFQLNIGDYAQATAHLTWLEEAAYWRLLRRYYADERALPADIQAVQRMVGARTRWEKQAVETVLREFFTLEDDGWHHKRCDAEIERYRAKQEKARASVSKRWGARADGKPASGNSESTCDLTHSQNASRLESESRKSLISQDQGDTNVSQTQYQPITNNQEPINKNNPPLPPTSSAGGECARGVIAAEMDDRFDRFWKAYPRKVGKDAARRAFAKRKPSEALLAKMLAAIAMQSQTVDWLREGGRFVPHPATWLNQGRWQDGEDDGAHDPHDGNGGYDWRKNPMFAGVI